jgi:hypothetical protein
MTDTPTVALADYLLGLEIDDHVTVEQEDSVRADWWRATCSTHDWYATGSKDTVGQAAVEHVVDGHPACSAPSERTFIGVPIHCRLQPGHLGDHMCRGYIWPNTKQPGTPDTDTAGLVQGTAPHASALVARKPLRCPLASCNMRLDDPRPLADWMLLGQSVGMDVTVLRDLNYLREHLETHVATEFVVEISRLTRLLEDEREAFRIATAALREGGAFMLAAPAVITTED